MNELNNKVNYKTITVQELNINGEGIFVENGNKTCVNNVLPNEEVVIKIKQTKGNFTLGEVHEILNKSSLRITPPCPYYKECGGCNFQFVNAQNALKLKKQILQNYFSNFYSGDIQTFSSENSFEYRNKASFFVNNAEIGFKKEGSNTLVKIDSCLILNSYINKSLTLLKNWVKSYGDSSKITHVVVRVLNKKVIVVVVATKHIKNFDKLIAGLKNCFLEGNFGLYLNINNEKSKILSENYVHIYGLERLETTFNEIKYFVHPNSFMQVNDEVKNLLYNELLHSLSEQEIVIEGYSGAGLLSALMAKKAKQVFSVEINKNASQDADILKKQNKIDNLENINGDCSQVLPKIIENYPNATFVLDPARSGCDNKTLSSILKSNIKKIIYISCNPYTLKQNIGLLKDFYKVTNMKLFDMFPQTTHMETLTILERVKK